jgi:hypothetical protein
MSAIIRARAMSCFVLCQEQTKGEQARFTVENGSEGSCNTTRARPHEFFDQTGAGSGKRPRDALGVSLPIGSHDV